MKKTNILRLTIVIILLSASVGYCNTISLDNFPKEKPKKIEQSKGKVKIPISDVNPAKRRLPEIGYREIASLLYGGKVEAIPRGYSEKKHIYTRIHPVIGALHYGFAHHRPVSLTPDIVWMMILQGFAKHISYNSDSLSPLLYADTSKVDITIRHDEFVRGSDANNWDAVYPEFSVQISEHTLPKAQFLFTKYFTTTNENIAAAYTITMMDAYSDKFNFEVLTACGIPYIVLEGSPEDWKWILETLPKLKKFGCEHWIKNLEPVIEEIYNSSKGKVNADFWKSMYKWESGSGGNTVTGWIIKFFPYFENDSGEKILNPYIDIDFTNSEQEEYMFIGMHGDDFTCGLSSCDFTWSYFGERIPMIFFGGFTGISQDENLVLKPEISWFISEKQNFNKLKNDSTVSEDDYFGWQEMIFKNAMETDFIESYEPAQMNFYELCIDPDSNPIFDPETYNSYEKAQEQFKIYVSDLAIEKKPNNKNTVTYYVLPDGTCDCESAGALVNYSEMIACEMIKYYLLESGLKWKPATKNGIPVMVKQTVEIINENQ